MDSYFKAAVCDLDKLLDDFELNTEEAENATFTSSVSHDPPLYHNHCPSSRCFVPEPATISVPQTLPDVNALHYGLSAPVCPNDQTGQDTSGAALTGVDLLSSVDSRASKNVTPPCPDRSLKPVCDLVNDTGPSNLPWTNSHDAFKEIEAAEKPVEEVLLVDFDSPAVSFPAGGLHRSDPAGSSACLSLLDVILPAAVERTAEPEKCLDDLQSSESQDVERPHSSRPEVSDSTELSCSSCSAEAEIIPGSPISSRVTEGDADSSSPISADVERSEEHSISSDTSPVPSDEGETSLSCLPMAVSMCGSFVASLDSQDDTEARTFDPETLESEICIAASEEAEPFQCIAQANCLPEDDTRPVQTIPNSEGPTPTAVLLPDRHTSSSSELLCSGDLPESSRSPSYTVSHDYHVEFGLTSDYLPESEQSMMMVTDEELDAYLMGHAERSCSETSGEKQVDDGFSEFNADLEELRSCGMAVDSFASPESDRSFRFQEESEGSNVSSSSQDSSPLNPDATPTDTSSAAPGPAEMQAACRSNQPLYYGGARPKQLSAQTARQALPQEEQSNENTSSEEEPASPGTPVPSQASNHSDSNSDSSSSHYDDLYGHEELSEPPPYPDEGASPGARSGTEDGGLGARQPPWVPDSEAPNCMKCGQKFTFTKRRHHCRACGKVYCAICCNRKCRLKYLEKEARVCVVCYEAIQKAQALERMMSPTGPSPNPNVPSEYCSTIPPMQQARAAGTLNSPPPTVMVPVSVLKQPSNDGFPREQKHVWFADGILPNGEVADTTKLSVKPRRSSQESSPVTPDPPAAQPSTKLPEGVEGLPGNPESGTEVPRKAAPSDPWDFALLSGLGGCVPRAPSLVPEDDEGLPPLLITTGEDDGGADLLVEERPAVCQIMLLLEEGGPRPLSFVLNANLLVNVQLASYCGRTCWCFSSTGLQGVGQRELVFVVERLPEENGVPRDIFSFYVNVYQDAQKGKYIEELGNVTLSDSFLGSKDHGGFLFFSLSFQPLEGLALPHSSFLCGVLIQKLEVPWAKVFPLRLLLSLGAEYNVYPCPLFSVRFRESVFKETGHTIMNLLADLRNYQYTVPVVDGLRIHMEVGNSYIDIPKSKLNEVLKVVSSSNEHVISIGACFSTDADSHLICVQNGDGTYQTQAKSTQGKTRRVTGASFVVFNGALKASSGFVAKSSIVEDGLMVQIPPETMDALRQALRDQTDFQISCGKADTAPEDRENVNVRWVDWTPPVNKGLTSPLDGRSLEGVPCVRLRHDSEFDMNGRTIRCTEVFYLLKTPDASLPVIPSCSQFQREIGTAVCAALCPHLSVLISAGINRLALRVSTDTDMVEYQAGSGGSLLPQKYLNELDGALIPVIHGGSSSVPHQAMDMELFFYITQTI